MSILETAPNKQVFGLYKKMNANSPFSLKTGSLHSLQIYLFQICQDALMGFFRVNIQHGE
jgi:hypothetical protein